MALANMMPPMTRRRPKYQVFISSTYVDLREEREEVIWQILSARYIPAGMEGFTATNDRGWETIRRVIDVSDYYVLIVAGVYGSVDAEGTSWTEREYNYATEKGVPVLAFLRNDNHITKDKIENVTKNAERLTQFKEKLKDMHHVKWWSNKEDLVHLVTESLRNHIADDEELGRARPAWFRGDSIDLSPDALEEFARLSRENESLRQQLENVTKGAAVLSLVDERGSEIKQQVIESIRYMFISDPNDRAHEDLNGLMPDRYNGFVNRKNRLAPVVISIKNTGSRVAKDITIDLVFSLCSRAMFVTEGPPQPGRAPGLEVSSKHTSPVEHVYIDGIRMSEDRTTVR